MIHHARPEQGGDRSGLRTPALRRCVSSCVGFRVWVGRVVWLLVLLWLLAPSPAQAAGDPYLEWWTIQTPHAKIHYYKGLEPIADRVADLFERLHDSMSEEFGRSPSQTVEIVITDNTDSANGSATAFPYNTIRLYSPTAAW